MVGTPLFSAKILYDIDDLKAMSDEGRKKYCVTVDDGLTFEEGLQNRQDMCIKVNVLYNENMWASPNEKAWNDSLQARKDGFFDKFGIIQPKAIWDAVVSGRLPKPTEKELNELNQSMKEMRI